MGRDSHHERSQEFVNRIAGAKNGGEEVLTRGRLSKSILVTPADAAKALPSVGNPLTQADKCIRKPVLLASPCGSSSFPLTRIVMSRDFLDTESRMFLDGMSSGFLDGYGGGIAGWLFHCINVERSQISIPFVTARRSHSFAKNWGSRDRRTTTSKTG